MTILSLRQWRPSGSDSVKAPSKTLVWLEHSAHMPMVEEPGHFFAALLRDVLPLTKDPK
jgi:proline iminopeptidase